MTIIFLIITTFMWATTFIFSKVILSFGVTVSFILFARFLLAAVIFYIVFHKKITFNKQVIKNGIIIGFFNGSAMFAQITGLKFSTASNTAFVSALFVIIVPIIEYLFWDTKLKFSIFVSIVLALTGVFLLSFSGFESFSINIGDLITLISSVLFAFQIFFISHYTKKSNIYGLIFFQFIISSFFAIGFFYLVSMFGLSQVLGMETSFLANTDIFYSFQNNIYLIPIINILGLVMIGTLIPYSLQFKVQERISPTFAGFGYMLEPVFALLLAIVFLNDKITIFNGSGIFLIFLSILLVNFSNIKFKRK